MTQEEKQELLIALCGYLPYGVIMRNQELGNDFELDGRTELTLTQSILYSITKFRAVPYLRPMSSMTEEEKNIYEYNRNSNVEVVRTALFDWLNKNKFDYRGLIPKGIALEAPKELYKQ